MKGIRVSGNLLDVLKPIVPQLDLCWWYLGGAGASLSSLMSTSPGQPPYSQKRLAAWQEEYERVAEEYSLWVDSDLASYRIGIPGFFSRYGNLIDTNWAKYFASDAQQAPLSSFDQVQSLNIDWFDSLPPLPPDICLYVRDIDAAYWDLFLRDDAAHDAVWRYLHANGYRPAPFKALPDEKPRNTRRQGRAG